MIFSAPGAYSPEKMKLDTTPKYSFGLRTSLDKPSDTPGIINTYLIRMHSLKLRLHLFL